MHNMYHIEEQSISCWVWREERLEKTTLVIPNPPCAIGEALNDLGYMSITRHEGKGCLTTYLYRQFEDSTTNSEQYVVLTIMSTLGGIYDDPETFQRGEIVLLPDWASVIGYISVLLPIVRDAEETDHNWDRGVD